MIITIDGPVATGKSTIARKLAERIGFIYFDTGAMYRSLTYSLIKNNVNFDDTGELVKFLYHFNFDIKMHHNEKYYFVDGEDITQQIRGKEVTDLVSKVSAIKEVREALLGVQRQWAAGVNAVFEGRDLGTVVFPNAELKIFLTGSMQVRGQRRFAELRAKFPEEAAHLTLEQAITDIQRRDTYDSTRDIAPLRQPDDAYVIDTTDFTPDEIVSQILDIRSKL